MFWKKKKDKDKSETWGKAARTGKWRSTTSLKAKLDKVFSMYIRLRDSKVYGYEYFRCVSCGRVLPFEQADCGHYISRTNMALRYSEDNCSAQCRFCNRFKDGNILDYRQGLIKKIGEQRVTLLEARKHEAKKWSNWELERLIEHYEGEVRKMRSNT